MAKQDTREFPQLPSHNKIKEAAYGYILSGGSYLARQLTKAVADALDVTPDQLELRFRENGQLAFRNYVSHVMREFTRERIHTGPNGGKHKNPNEKYEVTAHGQEMARRATENLPGFEKSQFQTPNDDLDLLAPTDDPDLLAPGVLPPPLGSVDVPQFLEVTTRFVRDRPVSNWVLDNANGACEVCARPAPFRDCDDHPFLEIHHVRPLASGGADTVDNAIAACPNCHRGLHLAICHEELRDAVISRIERLKDHPFRKIERLSGAGLL
jgi:hypothetical protein